MKKIVVTKKPPTFAELARDSLEECGNDSAAAKTHLYQRLMKNNNLLSALVSDVILRAASSSVSSAVGAQRAKTLAPIISNQGRLVQALARGIKASVLDMPITGGKALRYATGAEVLDMVERYRAISYTSTWRADWLEQVANSTTPGRMVGECICEEEALRMFESAKPKNVKANNLALSA